MHQFAGIQDVQKFGNYYVDDSARLMKRLAYIYKRLMTIGAGQLPARVNWDLKAGIARHLYEDSQAVKLFMKRITELRSPSTQRLKDPDPWLALFFDELLMARSDYELWVGIYEIVRPELYKCLTEYMNETQPLVDYPSVRLIKQVLIDLEEQLAWGKAIAPVLLEDSAFFRNNQERYSLVVDDVDSAKEYKENLIRLLDPIGGFEGKKLDQAIKVPDRWRSHQIYEIPKIAVRDPRMGGSTLGRTGVANPPEDPVMMKIVANARTRQEELGAAELCAATLFLQPNMPWEFYEDMARHCWDEMRHTLFGQAVLDKGGYEWFSQPQFKGDYDPHMKKPVANSYVWLSIGIEGSAMKKDAMPAESQDLRKKAKTMNDPFVSLFSLFVDFDWADEVTHHQYGRKWAEELIGDYHTSERIANSEMHLNLIRMAKDTHEYWKDKPDTMNRTMHMQDWEQLMKPELLEKIESID
jgi:hypothetical protein